jgi:multiple sugar transport system permease protein
MSTVTNVRNRFGGGAMTMQREERILGYLFIVPIFFLIGSLLLFPAAWAIWFSFTDKVVGQAANFVGLKNYVYILNWPDFGRTIMNTVVLAVVGVLGKMIVGMTMALALTRTSPAATSCAACSSCPGSCPASSPASSGAGSTTTCPVSSTGH